MCSGREGGRYKDSQVLAAAFAAALELSMRRALPGRSPGLNCSARLRAPTEGRGMRRAFARDPGAQAAGLTRRYLKRTCASRRRAKARRHNEAPGSARGHGARSIMVRPRRRPLQSSGFRGTIFAGISAWVASAMHTFTSIYLHVVFATWSREPSLVASIRPRLHAYIASTARNLGVCDVYAGGHEDHIHLLGRFDPATAPSSVIGQVKQSASSWLNDELQRFRWQRGFSAFSVSRDRVPGVARYIRRQEAHHRKTTFRGELEKLLRECGIEFEDAHLF